MEHILESFYEGFGVFVFCMAVALLFIYSDYMDKQANYVKTNIYEQHMLYGAKID